MDAGSGNDLVSESELSPLVRKLIRRKDQVIRLLTANGIAEVTEEVPIKLKGFGAANPLVLDQTPAVLFLVASIR